MHSGGRKQKSISAREEETSAAEGSDPTYAVSVCLRVRSVPEVGMRGRSAAPTVGRRVGGSSGNYHVKGRVRRLLHEVIRWSIT